MDVKSIRKGVSTAGLALSFVLLTACGGGGGSDAAPAVDPGTVSLTEAQIEAAQALVDANVGVSPFDYAAATAARTSCLDATNDVIDTENEISCYQDFLETIAAIVDAPVV